MTIERTFNKDFGRTCIGVLTLLAAAGFLSACGGGGGGGGGAAALPQPGPRQNPGAGINGGIVMGKGSTIVNAVEFSVADPTVTIDGASGTEAQVLEGMIVTMRGTFGPLEPQGTATAVEVEPQLIGRVDAVGGGTITVLNQAVTVNNFTVFDPDNSNRNLVVGDVVEVHGFFTGSGTPHTIEATFIRRVVTTKRQIRGIVAGTPATGTFTIGGQTVTNNSPTIPLAGDFVEVEGTQPVAGGAIATTSTGVQVDNFEDNVDQEVEIEGAVAAAPVGSEFQLLGPSGPIRVRFNTTFTTQFQLEERNLAATSAILTAGAQVEVEGRLIGGILQAREIELKRRENVALEGDVTGLSGTTFTLAPFGATINFAGAVITPPGATVSNGAHVDVGGEVTPPGASLSSVTVTRVTVLPASANRRLQGPVSAHGSGADGTTDSITILGITVDTTGLQDRDDPVLGLPSEFQDASNFRISKSKFFSLLRDNISVVRAKAARNAVTGAEPFTTGPPAAFTPSSGVELEEHR
ncbi:MAG: DUF5666 domain-containing protein [Deltaproteobacteria bacterium]